MIPRRAIELDVVVPDGLSTADPVPIGDDASCVGSGLWFRDTWEITGIDTEIAREVMTTEAALVAIADRLAADEAAFDEVANAIEGAYVDDLIGVVPDDALEQVRDLVESSGMSPTEGLDLGVAGLVHALCASGYRTEASCRGHPDPAAWSERPIVYFVADRQRHALLAPLVVEAGCGLGAVGGSFFIEAQSITEMMELARLVMRSEVS